VARPAFGGRRALSRIGQLLAFAGVVMLVAGFLGLLAGASGPVLDAGARTLIDGAGATGSVVRVQTRLADDAEDQDAAVQQAITTSLGGLPASIQRTVVAESAPGTIDGEPVQVQGLTDPGLPDAARIVEGEWPSGTDEGALQEAAASSLGVSVGDEIVVGDTQVTIVGIWVARDPGEARWFGDPAVGSGVDADAVGPLLVDESVLAPLGERPFVRWTVVPERSAMERSNLGDWGEALVRLTAELRRIPSTNSALEAIGSLSGTLERTARSTSIAAGIMGLPLVLLIVAGGVVITLVARAIAAGRRVEFALLRARGASMRSLTGAAAREAFVASLIGGALGAGAAVGALLLGIPVLLPASAQTVVPLLVGGIAAIVVVLAVVLATIVTVVELRAPVSGRAESGRAALIASLGPLILAVVVAGFTVAQFVALGSPIVVRGDGTVFTDPLALAAPMALLVAVALAAPVVVGPLSLVGERFARAGRGILPVLPLRQLSRRARSVAAGVLVIALAVGAAVLVGAIRFAADAGAEHAERAATGSDLRVKYAVRSTVGPGFSAASALSVADVSGIDSAFAVLGPTASIGPDAVPLVASDPARLAEVTGADPLLATMVDELESSRRVQSLPEGSRELTMTVDLTPLGDLPEDTELELIAWLCDADGSALYQSLGSVPADVAGPVTVTAPLPPGATGILALGFSPPTLPEFVSIGVHLDELTTDAGDVGWAGQADAEITEPARILPPRADELLPVVITRELSERISAPVGTPLGIRLAGLPAQLPLRVAGVVEDLPGIAGPLGVVVDLQSLESAALSIGGAVPAADQLWLSAEDPDAAVAGLRASLDMRADIITPSTVSTRPVVEPATLLFATGAAATLVLAVLGFAAVAASIGRQRVVELTPLRSLGLTAARVRRARAIELVASAVLAILVGAAGGTLTAWIVVPSLVAVAT
jgi:hypothetical protein